MENETARYAAASVTNGRLTALYREDEPFPKQYFGTKMIDLQGKTVFARLYRQQCASCAERTSAILRED